MIVPNGAPPQAAGPPLPMHRFQSNMHVRRIKTLHESLEWTDRPTAAFGGRSRASCDQGNVGPGRMVHPLGAQIDVLYLLQFTTSLRS